MKPKLPDYDRWIIEAVTETLRQWIDKNRGDMVWLKIEDIIHLEKWAKDLAERYRETEFDIEAAIAAGTPQPYEGCSPAEPWKHYDR